MLAFRYAILINHFGLLAFFVSCRLEEETLPQKKQSEKNQHVEKINNFLSELGTILQEAARV